MKKGIIYYTDNRIPESMAQMVREQMEIRGLSIISVSLKPINFGENIVLNLSPSVLTMFTQILTGLEASSADIVFLAEHDVFYHPSHFDFFPMEDDVYYFNANNWRWKFPIDHFITYDHLTSLSGICACRKLLLNHYRRRMAWIAKKGYEDGRDPNWARKMGYEPGKLRRRGGFMDEKTEEWRSAFPNIDIRHKRTLTPPKVTLDSFRHLPTNWQEATFDQIPGWNHLSFRDLLEMVNLGSRASHTEKEVHSPLPV